MTVTVNSFRANFPEFANAQLYTDAEVTFWMELGLNLINAPRWGNLADYGQQLFMAHNLSLQYGALKAAKTGQNPGQVQGPITGGTVDKVSYQRNPGLLMDPKNGHWNLSIYGLRYIMMIRMVGAGPLQVGVPPSESNYGASGAGAWAGPWQYNFPNPS